MELDSIYELSNDRRKYEFSKPYRYLMGGIVIYMLVSLIFYFLALFFFYHNVTYAIGRLSSDLEQFQNNTSGLLLLSNIVNNLCNETMFHELCL